MSVRVHRTRARRPESDRSGTRAVILLSASPAGLAVIRGLARHGVPVVVLQYDRRDIGQHARGVGEVVRVPFPDADPDGVLRRIEPLARRYAGALLMAGSDAAVTFLARHKSRLEGLGFAVAAASDTAVSTFLDKNETAALAQRAGVSMPRTVELAGEADIDRYADLARFPAVVKPAVGHRYHLVFGRKWTMVEDVAAATHEFRAARDRGFQVSLQEFIPGDESCGANYICYRWETGQVEFTARKVRNSPRESGSPSVTRSEWIPELLDSGRRILAAADYQGFACIELKRDPRDGQYRLIEVNARPNLSGMLALRCGVNFPWLQYRHLMFSETPQAPAFAEGVHWIDITRDVKNIQGYLVQPEYSVGRFLAPYRSPKVFAVLSGRDPRPAYTRAVDTVRVLATGRRHGNFFGGVRPRRHR
jgi:predicted ATP-grasp superfamily ATP-dependent carboligase